MLIFNVRDDKRFLAMIHTYAYIYTHTHVRVSARAHTNESEKKNAHVHAHTVLAVLYLLAMTGHASLPRKGERDSKGILER